MTLHAASNYDGTTTLSAGELHLDFGGAGVSTNLLYNGLSTPGGLTISGSTLRLTGRSGTTTSQQFGNLAIGVGQSYITTVQNGATAMNVSFGNISRALSGSVLEFTPPTAGSYTTTGGVNDALSPMMAPPPSPGVKTTGPPPPERWMGGVRSWDYPALWTATPPAPPPPCQEMLTSCWVPEPSHWPQALTPAACGSMPLRSTTSA
ncbi:hypothetical protein [Verrucomicrobium spinosum]|uniref:hypothetical protein n=1 Tax=Verrucomicrobium spinosum TaxID=2736 RepID=UPI000946395A|nr:hypothetical protein [Verrucomicrobium spinosum]